MEDYKINPELEQMPKLELHCHLGGSLSRGCIEGLLGREVAPSLLEADPQCASLAQYLEKFDIPLQCLSTEEGLKAGAYDFMRTVSGEHVVYAEVRFAPLLSVHENMDCRAVIESVLEGLEKGREDFGTDFGVIVCAMRHMSLEENLEMLKVSREFLGSGVCAADLAGNEAAFPMSIFGPLFAQVKKWGMPFTIHAGECGDAGNIADAISCGAGRIGHGIAMSGHPDLIELCRNRHTGIEMCPISNMQTKAVQDIRLYPMKEYLEKGLLVTVNTDNRTVSNTSLKKEIGFIQKHFGITREEVLVMMRNAAEAAFASDSMKHRLLQIFK